MVLPFAVSGFSFFPGVASCSHHAVSGTSSQSLSSAVTVMFIPFLQQEGIGAPPFPWCNQIPGLMF